MFSDTSRGKLCSKLVPQLRTDNVRLQMEAFSLGIEIHRKIFSDIREVFKMYTGASVVFNCTGLGSLTLGGVMDKKLYPARVGHL